MICTFNEIVFHLRVKYWRVYFNVYYFISNYFKLSSSHALKTRAKKKLPTRGDVFVDTPPPRGRSIIKRRESETVGLSRVETVADCTYARISSRLDRPEVHGNSHIPLRAIRSTRSSPGSRARLISACRSYVIPHLPRSLPRSTVLSPFVPLSKLAFFLPRCSRN